MKFAERINSATFNDNKKIIQVEWDTIFGDRKIELVFIVQHLGKYGIINHLNKCLFSDDEVEVWKEKSFPQKDQWPIAI